MRMIITGFNGMNGSQTPEIKANASESIVLNQDGLLDLGLHLYFTYPFELK
jgi:hypothetical protein